jgi:Flp pilus assembly protein TadD
LAKSPDSAVVRSLMAETAVRVRKYDVAIKQYEQLEMRGGKSAQLELRLGGVYQLEGDTNKAIGYFQTARDLAPRDPTAIGALADAFRLAGRDAEALVNYQRLLTLDSENPNAMNNVAFLILNNGGSVNEAQRLAEHALQKSPQDPNFADTLGMIYLKKDLEDSAVQVFSSLVRRFPNSPEYRFHYALSLTRRGEKAKARTELQLALRKSPSDDLRRSIETTLAKIE